MSRDDFSRQTLDTLAKRVGVRCSNPSCGKPTAGPRSSATEAVNIGVGAHITAAAPGGPRFDGRLSSEQRQAIENAIWLCQNCAKLIDNDPVRYTVSKLLEWKTGAESSAQADIEGRARQELPVATLTLELSYRKERIEGEHHDYMLQVHLTNTGVAPLGPYYIDVKMPAMIVHKAETQLLYVQSRSDHHVAHFRVDSQRDRRGEVIYPGDKQLVMTVHYFMDDNTYRARGQLFAQQVTATCYRQDFPPATTTRTFGELQVF
jgi:hypothetical protein